MFIKIIKYFSNIYLKDEQKCRSVLLQLPDNSTLLMHAGPATPTFMKIIMREKQNLTLFKPVNH